MLSLPDTFKKHGDKKTSDSISLSQDEVIHLYIYVYNNARCELIVKTVSPFFVYINIYTFILTSICFLCMCASESFNGVTEHAQINYI